MSEVFRGMKVRTTKEVSSYGDPNIELSPWTWAAVWLIMSIFLAMVISAFIYKPDKNKVYE